MSLSKCTTREFLPQYYSREIKSTVNGFLSRSSKRVVNLYVSVKNVPDISIFQSPNVLCVLNRTGSNGFQEYSRSEVCWQRTNPFFVRPFTLPINNDVPELLLFELYHVKNCVFYLDSQMFIGDCQIDLRNLLNSPTHSQKVTVQLAKDADDTSVSLTVSYFDILPDIVGCALFSTSFMDLNNGSYIHRPNPYYVIQRYDRSSQSLIPVYKSAVVFKTKDGNWPSSFFHFQYICGGDLNLPLRICVYSQNTYSTDQFIGYCDVTMAKILNRQGHIFKLKNFVEGNINDTNNSEVGKIRTTMIGRVDAPRIEDLRLKGLSFQTLFAVDFTDITYFMTYRTALIECCDALSKLTLGQPYKAVGFAADEVFPLYRQKDTFQTIKSLIEFFEKTRKARDGKKANLCPVLRYSKEFAERNWSEKGIFTVLVVLTYSNIQDLKFAVKELVHIDSVPIAISILTIGCEHDEIDEALRHKHGILKDGNTLSKRRVCKIIEYEERFFATDENIGIKLSNQVGKMTQAWFDLPNGNGQT